MNVEQRSTCKAVGFRSPELWAIIAVLFLAGVAIGFPIGQIVEKRAADGRLDYMRNAYSQAMDAKEESIKLCLDKAADAIDRSTMAIDHILQGHQCNELSRKDQ